MPRYTNKENLPRSWVNAVAADTYDGPRDLDHISVTSLALPPRVRVLTARHWGDITMDVADRPHSLFGEAIHYVVSKAADNSYVSEERIECKVSNRILTGKPDLYDKIEQVIEDYKTTSVFHFMHDKEDFEIQLNVYAWLETEVMHRPVKRILNVVYMKDWRLSELYKYQNYPSRNLKKWYPKLWTTQEQKRYIESRIEEHSKYDALKDEEQPLCTERERWSDSDIFAVYKVTNGKRSARAVDAQQKTEESAKDRVAELEKKNPKALYEIVFRKGSDKRCINYCDAKEFCSYWREHYET